MSAPSSVETSTSTGSGDWLYRGGRGSLTGLFLSARFHPALRSRTDSPTALSKPLRLVLRRGGLRWKSYDGRNSTGSPKSRNYWGERGPASFFFPFWFFICIFFFQNKWSPSALSLLILTVCVRRWVRVCLLNLLVLFKLFLKRWEEKTILH